MDNPFGVGSAGAGGGILGIIFGYFGLGSRITRIEKKMDNNVVFKDTFEQFEKRCDDNFDDIKELIANIKKD